VPNEQQATYWSEQGGPEWVRNENRYETMLAPIGESVITAAALAVGERVLDIGCGFGTLTLAAAHRVAPGGRVTGVDISGPMVERAIARAAGTPDVSFAVDDAQTMSFDEPPFDVVVSQMGVMFFDDPVGAFANIASGMSAESRLAFACWQSIDVNPWIRVVPDVLGSYLPEPFVGPPPRQPGPMAFAEAGYVRDLLRRAGWTDVELLDLQTPLVIGSNGVDAAIDQVLSTSVGRLIWPQIAEDDRPAALDALRTEVATHATGSTVVYDGAAWIVTARLGR
jgi:SAM-dependent methyltransferase